MKFDLIKDKRKISKNKGIQIFMINKDKYQVFVGGIKKSNIVSFKKANSIANQILKERIKRINKSFNSPIRKKIERQRKFNKFLSRFV